MEKAMEKAMHKATYVPSLCQYTLFRGISILQMANSREHESQSAVSPYRMLREYWSIA